VSLDIGVHISFVLRLLFPHNFYKSCLEKYFRSRGRLRLASAGLTITTAATATAAGGLSTLLSGLLTVVVAAGVAVTEGYVLVSPSCLSKTVILKRTGLVAVVHAGTTTASIGLSVTSGLLLGGITLSGAISGAVDSLRGGRRGAAGVELWVVA
jgi:hypothetical protein